MSEMMRLPIIAVDGNHRVGKGTQLRVLSEALESRGYAPVILRGDGTRACDSSSSEDPHADWWRSFKSQEGLCDNGYEMWRMGARMLLSEAALRIASLRENGVVLFDRAGISRAQMTLKEGMNVAIDTMYGAESYYSDGLEQKTIIELQPGITFFLSASPSVLLDRLNSKDEKFAFRQRNIVESNPFFNAAQKLYGNLGVSRVIGIDAEDAIEEVSKQIIDVSVEYVESGAIINAKRIAS